MVVHGDKLRWLAWLRVRMFIRGFRRRPATLVFAIIGLLVLLFFAGEMAIGLVFAFQNLSAPANTEVLYLFLSGALLFWIVMPLLSYSTNEGLDVTKLQLFPLTRLELMFSLLFSSLFDIWTVFLFILFGATVVAWWLYSPALGLLTLLVIAVFYMVMVSISQLILSFLMRTLQSRRFRDLSVIIIALFGSSCYLISRLATSAGNLRDLGTMLNSGSFSAYLQWLPSGVAAGAIRAASQGSWGESFALLGGLVLIGALAFYLWQLVLERSMTASETGAARRARQGKQTAPALASQASAVAPVSASTVAPATGPAARVERSVAGRTQEVRTASTARVETDPLKANLFEQLQALVRKELICFWRDPQLKVRMIQPLILSVLVIVLPAVNDSGGNSNHLAAQYTPFVATAIVLLFMLTIAQNTLGIERQSLTTLFLFPTDRRRLLWGKNLAVFSLGIVVLLIMMVLCVVLAREPGMVLPAIVVGLSGIGVALGWGNVASTFYPRYQPQIGQRGYQATGGQAQSGGCLNSVMALVMMLVTIVTLTPVALGIAIPFFLNMSWLLVATIPLSLAYGLVLYIVLTNLSARRLLATEPEILAVTTRE